ncbi:DUF4352 domain-containing protein [uncultured Thermomonospora sp.]|mgnify:CR=1 FL=1|uniref:DUF4352 domain-containing protein n=1 Tax=uncultured Thermomonospora sp. TaxID=671175 RepID=UPI00259BD21D|nr:DUF4352 domain-containing protein [uncultured Thermomonospora sp.]
MPEVSGRLLRRAVKCVVAGAAVVLVAACGSQEEARRAAPAPARPIQEVGGVYDASPTPAPFPNPTLPQVQVGETGRAGDLELSVEEAKAATTARKLFSGVHRAQGRFVIVPVTMKNLGKEPFSMLEFMEATLTDVSGATYNQAREVASDQSIRGTSNFNWEINPSSKGKVVLVFDLPKEVQPSFITVEGIATIRF